MAAVHELHPMVPAVSSHASQPAPEPRTTACRLANRSTRPLSTACRQRVSQPLRRDEYACNAVSHSVLHREATALRIDQHWQRAHTVGSTARAAQGVIGFPTIHHSGEDMTARNKLNAANFNGAAILGTLVGFYFQSVVAGFVTWLILLAGCLHDGSIRPRPSMRR